MSQLDLRGVHTALITPFRGGKLDIGAAQALAKRQVDAGVQGLVPCGTTGETPTLDTAEWAQTIEIAVATARGAKHKVLVTAGCGTNNTASTVANIRGARALGADLALVVLPYYNKPNPAGLRAHVAAACEVGLPVVLYHVPGRTAQHVPVGLLAELANIPGVAGVKEATGDIRYGSDLVEGTGACVLSGDDFTWLPLLSVGGQGVISVLSNVDPWRCVQLSKAAAAGDYATAAKLHHAMMPLMRYLFAEVNPVPCKAAMAALGLCENELRLPLAAGAAPPPALLDGLGS